MKFTDSDCYVGGLLGIPTIYTEAFREKCPNTEFFLVRIFCIRPEYGDLWSKSPYSVRIQENTDQKKLGI